MSEKVDIFGVKFDNMTVEQIAALLLNKMNTNDSGPVTVFTPNPEIVMAAQKNERLFTALDAADIICADGVGIVWASTYFGCKIKKRASGYDVVQELFKLGAEKGGFNAFFYGGSEDAVIKAAEKTSVEYPGINILGTINGYFNDSETILKKINESAPDLLLVGLGSPKQELWVYDNSPVLNAKVIMVVGGSFDVMSGNLTRAPEFLRRLGLEWLYRLFKQPKRLFRMMRLPLFVLKVLFGKKGLVR